MARCAIVKNGVVVNTAEASEDFAVDQGWVVSDVAQIGWLYDGEAFIQPPQPPEPVPTSISPRQIRRALLSAGLLDDLEAAMSSMSRAAQIDWEFAGEVLRDSPLVEEARVTLARTQEQVDDLFRLGATL